jgi:hypothetical protein
MMKQGRALGLEKQQLDFREAQHANIMSFAGQDGGEISRAPSMVSEAQSQMYDSSGFTCLRIVYKLFVCANLNRQHCIIVNGGEYVETIGLGSRCAWSRAHASR